MKDTIFFTPVFLKVRKRQLSIKTQMDINLSKIKKQTKIVSAMSDIIPISQELFNFKIDFSCDDFSISADEKYGKSISFAGLLRGLLYLKYRYPTMFKEFKEVAKALSYSVNENHKVPSLSLIEENKILNDIFTILEEKVGLSIEGYSYMVLSSMKEQGILEKVASFSIDKDEDKEKMMEVFIKKDGFLSYEKNPEKEEFKMISSSSIVYEYEKSLIEELEEKMRFLKKEEE